MANKHCKKFNNHADYINSIKAGQIIKYNVSYCKNEKDLHYNNKTDYSLQYFTTEALENGTFTFTINKNLSVDAVPYMSYSIDNGNSWTTVNNVNNTNVTLTTPTVQAGTRVLWKSNSVQFLVEPGYYPSQSTRGIAQFSSTCQFNVSGNIMSLLYEDNFSDKTSFKERINSGPDAGEFSYMLSSTKVVSAANLILPVTTLQQCCYLRMFMNCKNLTTAPELPATYLGSQCYNYMFSGCTSLTTAPELPATTLANNCYSNMFYGCTSLTTAPELSATTLAGQCYYNMFRDCTSLTTVPQILPATTLANSCYEMMFYGCISLITVPELPATTLAERCYKEMFKDCINLTTAPELPATQLQSECYYGMFYGTNALPDCSNIDFTSQSIINSEGLRGLFAGTKVTDNDLRNILPINPTTNNYYLPVNRLAIRCYQDMFSNCTNLTTAPELPATTLYQQCYSGMFNGCTSLTTVPELPATTLISGCYDYMFDNCQNLNYIKAMFTTQPSNTYTAYWLRGVASTGTFVKNSAATWNVRGVNGIPSGWTVQTASA